MDTDATLSFALALADDFRAGTAFAVVVAAEAALVGADLDADGLELDVVLHSWLALEMLAARLGSEALDSAMAAAEEALLPQASALLLLNNDRYQAAVRGHSVSLKSWAGHPLLLNEQVPERAVRLALSDVADAASGP